ncbi:hypothetical protein, partial [Nocardia brasiliensis]|uniref:hypothetical protein n=1 Tax=Nocardia brasiliensis TaxID=37326 RepID=UPI002454D0C0
AGRSARGTGPAPVLCAPWGGPGGRAGAGGAGAVGGRAATPRRATSRTDRRLPYRAFMVTQYAVHIAVLATLLIVGVH